MDKIVKQGDTLSKIAQENKTDVATLVRLNNISNPDIIQTGQVLKLPSAQIASTAPITPIQSQPTPITSESLSSISPITIQPQTIVPQTAQPNIVQDIISNNQIKETDAQRKAGDLSSKLFNLLPQLSGESQAFAQAQKDTGVDTLKSDLQNINSQIIQKQAEVNLDDARLLAQLRAEERRDTLLPFAQSAQAKLAGDAQIIRGLKNAEIGVLNASAIAKQGNIALAKQTAEDAVNLRYAPYKEAISIYQGQLKMLEPLLSRDEKAQANIQKIKADLALKEIERTSDFQKTALNNAIQNNAPLSVQQAINKANSIDSILSAGQGYFISPKEQLELSKLGLDIQKTKGDIAKQGVEYAKTLNELNKAKQVIGGTTGDVSGDLILGSSSYAGKQPSAGWIDDFTQAGIALGNVKELQKLIDKQGDTGFITGNVSSLFSKFSSDQANAAAINAQIQRTVPGLARGIFKEVGVLTDQDVANYKKTLPNLTSPAAQNKLALLATYDVIERSLATTLANQAKAKNDVSGYYSDYINVKNEVKKLKTELGFVEDAQIPVENRAKLEGAWGQINSPQITDTLNNFLK